jgi:hypothetical protein
MRWCLFLVSSESVTRQRQQWGGVFFLVRSEAVTRGRGSPLFFTFRKTPRKRQYIGQVNPNCKRIKFLWAIKDKIKVNNKCEVEYTSFLSLLCPWRLDGLRAGQPGLDSRHGQVCLFSTMSRLGPGPTKPPVQWVQGALSPGVKRPGREAERTLFAKGWRCWERARINEAIRDKIRVKNKCEV